MTDEHAPVRVVRPGEGRMGDLGDITIDFKIWGADTGGAFAIVEHEFRPGALVPPHIHTREDEHSIVTAGLIGFRSGTARPSSDRAATSPSRAARPTPCGTPARSRHA